MVPRAACCLVLELCFEQLSRDIPSETVIVTSIYVYQCQAIPSHHGQQKHSKNYDNTADQTHRTEGEPMIIDKPTIASKPAQPAETSSHEIATCSPTHNNHNNAACDSTYGQICRLTNDHAVWHLIDRLQKNPSLCEQAPSITSGCLQNCGGISCDAYTQLLHTSTLIDGDIIDLYFQLLHVNCKVAEIYFGPSTYFVSQVLMTKAHCHNAVIHRNWCGSQVLSRQGYLQTNILDYDQHLWPVFVDGNHWVLLDINIPAASITMLDSMSATLNKSQISRRHRIMHTVSDFLKGHAAITSFDKRSIPPTFAISVAKGTPQQTDVDCALYVCMWARCAALGIDTTWMQTVDICDVRMWIALELYHGCIGKSCNDLV